MARQLTWWLAGAFVACAIVAVGYLLPGGAAPAATARSRQPQPTAARLRARGLAEQWRAADLAVRLAVYRRRLEPELARRRAADQPGPALLVEAPDTVPVHTRELVASALDTVWRELGLGVSKVAVGVVVDFWRFPRTGTDSTPKVPSGSVGYRFERSRNLHCPDPGLALEARAPPPTRRRVAAGARTVRVLRPVGGTGRAGASLDGTATLRPGQRPELGPRTVGAA